LEKLSDKLGAKKSGDLHTGTNDDEESGPPDPKKQKCATARYVDDNRKKLQKKISTRQKESLMLDTTEDVELTKKLLKKTPPKHLLQMKHLIKAY